MTSRPGPGPRPEGQAPEPPRVAAEIFGDRLPLARRYADLLAGTGVGHGLLGPRETPRLWDRHLLNCAVVETMLPHRTRLIDVGTGGGLPGLVLALVRPDLEVTLIEPLLRRTRWLDHAVTELDLRNVLVLRGRAQDFISRVQAPVVTARAVARLADLAAWCLPLVAPGGALLALKGATAQRELEEDSEALDRLPLTGRRLVELGGEQLSEPTRVVELRRETPRVAPPPPAPRRR